MLDKITILQSRHKRALTLTVRSAQFAFHLISDNYFYIPHALSDLSIITPSGQVLGCVTMVTEAMFGLFELCPYTSKPKTPYVWLNQTEIQFDTGEHVYLLPTTESINKLLLVEMLARYIHTLWTIEDSVYDSYTISD